MKRFLIRRCITLDPESDQLLRQLAETLEGNLSLSLRSLLREVVPVLLALKAKGKSQDVTAR
jgi:hypothetical protein